MVLRADGVWAYQLAVVVDDLAMGVTEVVRGDDLLASTPAQALLCRTLGAEPPAYAHVPLLVDQEGRRLAKRTGSLTLRSLRESGVRPERVVGLLAFRLGLLDRPLELTATEALLRFDPLSLPGGPFRIEDGHLAWLRGDAG